MSARLVFGFAVVTCVAGAAAQPLAAVSPPRPFSEPSRAEQACGAKPRSAKLNLTLKDLSGSKVKLATFKGKVIVLNFWATWCAPCKVEIPGFVELQDRYGSRGLQLIGISVDDTADKLKAYAEEQKMNYPVLQGRGHGEILDMFSKVETLPTTILITRDGTICKTYPGPVTQEALEAEIQPLL